MRKIFFYIFYLRLYVLDSAFVSLSMIKNLVINPFELIMYRDQQGTQQLIVYFATGHWLCSSPCWLVFTR